MLCVFATLSFSLDIPYLCSSFCVLTARARLRFISCFNKPLLKKNSNPPLNVMSGLIVLPNALEPFTSELGGTILLGMDCRVGSAARS
jgi:hypothetical protein